MVEQNLSYLTLYASDKEKNVRIDHTYFLRHNQFKTQIHPKSQRPECFSLIRLTGTIPAKYSK
jgi:hypothetical protein